MEYKSFTIHDYRAIRGPLKVDLSKKLIPIIGVNECGKTTVLQAILAFDSYNDSVLGGKHLSDIENLYDAKPNPPRVVAEIEAPWSRIEMALRMVAEEKGDKSGLKYYRDKRPLYNGKITIQRNLITKRYSILEGPLAGGMHGHGLAHQLVRFLPYTIYFDDFRDSIKENIEIDSNSKDFWYRAVAVLFEKSNCGIDLDELPNCEERRRKAALSKVNAHLKRVLTEEWQNFRLDDSDALKVSVEYVSGSGSADKKPYVKFEVVETSKGGEEHFFYIRDRSKGFFWFFNFVMKLQFNPSVVAHADSQKAIFLLDEPGCYLHATAQKKLCKKFVEIATENVVLYCTHSHYLLDPQIVPIQGIQIAGRSSTNEVTLTPISKFNSNLHESRMAFQPVLDSLELTPFSMELMGKKVVIVEGVTDYYVLSAIIGDKYKFLPSVGASSVKYSIPFLLASATPFCSLWDNDDRGRAERKTAISQFGDEFSETFILLPLDPGKKNTVLEDLFAGDDLTRLAEALGFSPRVDKKKIFASMYYSPNSETLTGSLSAETKMRFEELEKQLEKAFQWMIP